MLQEQLRFPCILPVDGRTVTVRICE